MNPDPNTAETIIMTHRRKHPCHETKRHLAGDVHAELCSEGRWIITDGHDQSFLEPEDFAAIYEPIDWRARAVAAEAELKECAKYHDTDEIPSEILAGLHDLLLDVSDDEACPSGNMVSKVDALKRGCRDLALEMALTPETNRTAIKIDGYGWMVSSNFSRHLETQRDNLKEALGKAAKPMDSVQLRGTITEQIVEFEGETYWVKASEVRKRMEILREALSLTPNERLNYIGMPEELSASQAEARRLKWLISQVLGDLPEKRDWLNPDIEREIKALAPADGKGEVDSFYRGSPCDSES